MRLSEADSVADLAPQLDLELLGHAGRDAGGRDAARLGDPDVRLQPAAHGEADLGELGGLARAGLARDDRPPGAGRPRPRSSRTRAGDRQLFGEADGARHPGGPGGFWGGPWAPTIVTRPSAAGAWGARVRWRGGGRWARSRGIAASADLPRRRSWRRARRHGGAGALRGSCGGRAAEAAGPRARERGRRWWPPQQAARRRDAGADQGPRRPRPLRGWRRCGYLGSRVSGFFASPAKLSATGAATWKVELVGPMRMAPTSLPRMPRGGRPSPGGAADRRRGARPS